MSRHHDPTSLLAAAIEDNIGWCSTVCTAHGSDEQISLDAWVNLLPSPPYYPNIITRRPRVQAEVVRLVDIVQKRNSQRVWGIKDSFRDLDLTALGFTSMIEGQWFGGEPAGSRKATPDWEVVGHPEELTLWEKAWSGESDQRIFKGVLLADSRIKFWKLHQAGDIVAGCISFASGPVIGLSNWFSKEAETAFDLGILQAVAETAPGCLLVCWSSAEEAAPAGLNPLGALRIWMPSVP